MLGSSSVALRITFLLLFFNFHLVVNRHHHTSSSYIINPLVILHVVVTSLLHEVVEVEILFLDREGFLVIPTSMSSDDFIKPLSSSSFVIITRHLKHHHYLPPLHYVRLPIHSHRQLTLASLRPLSPSSLTSNGPSPPLSSTLNLYKM